MWSLNIRRQVVIHLRTRRFVWGTFLMVSLGSIFSLAYYLYLNAALAEDLKKPNLKNGLPWAYRNQIAFDPRADPGEGPGVPGFGGMMRARGAGPAAPGAPMMGARPAEDAEEAETRR